MRWTRANAGQISPRLGSASKKRSGPTSRVCATRGPRSRGNISRSRNPDEWANATDEKATRIIAPQAPGGTVANGPLRLGVQARRPTALISSALTCDVTDRCHSRTALALADPAAPRRILWPPNSLCIKMPAHIWSTKYR
jgi:hypothetical protein